MKLIILRCVRRALQSAVQVGLENNADILVSIDADGQCDRSEIQYLIQPILANQADMVIGNRFTDGIPKDTL